MKSIGFGILTFITMMFFFSNIYTSEKKYKRLNKKGNEKELTGYGCTLAVTSFLIGLAVTLITWNT